DSQYGLRPKRSTQDAILKLTNSVMHFLNEGKKVLAIYIDISKAFDCVNHSLLIEKLNKIGLNDSARLLISSYLKNRIQYVKIDQRVSSAVSITYGVPQGSVL